MTKNSLSFYLTLLIGMIVSCQSRQANEPLVSEMIWSEEGINLNTLKMPEGFKAEIYARVPNARSMTISPTGTLFVSNRSGGSVYAVVDKNGDYKAEKVIKIDSNLNMPNGVAFKNGSLYVAEINKLWRYDQIEQKLGTTTYQPKLIYDDYPSDKHHGWKYIAFGPDGKLYVPVGAPCNICESKNPMYASITRMEADGSNREVFVHGVRNTVGFTWHPVTNEMWFTDNGRDLLGDDIPPCELNRVSKSGEHFGYPYCHGGTLTDPEFGHKFPCSDFTRPAQNLGPHVAPLGLKFYTGNMFPAAYTNTLLIAEHGSWNRSSAAGHTGYRITQVVEKDGKGISYEVFIDGFLDKTTNKAWGRPVDILVLNDGSILISDDLAGAIYRITYTSI